MSTEPTLRGPVEGQVRRSLSVVVLLALSLVLSAFAIGRVAAIGQPSLGFSEPTAGELFQVMGPDWTVRTSLAFSSTETVRVNVTSASVDWQGNAGGGGSLLLDLRRYNGNVIFGGALFNQVQSFPVSVYTASIDLSSLILTPDWYYLRIFIDDTVNNPFEAMTAIHVDAAVAPHSIETFTDNTFTHTSDVFTSTSTMWVRIRSDPGADADQWNIAEFVNANRPVGGPRGAFSNFQARGDLYTFSIDLSAWAGNFRSGWYYTFSARLAGPDFDAGKQIQIFDPTLTISWTDIAPSQAYKGQTDVPMLALSLSLNANWATLLGPAAFNLERLRFVRTGTPGSNADISQVRVWDDANGNGALDAGDVVLASAMNLGGLPFPVWVGQNGVAMTTVESTGPRHLLVTYDISPTATAGDYAGARIEAAADVDVAGRFAGVGGLPAQSMDVQILARDVLTVTDDPGIAPGTATTGQPGVAVDLLTMSTNGGLITVNRVSVMLAGTGSAADIVLVSLHVDDGNGLYDPALDPLLGAPMAFPITGPAVLAGFTFDVTAAGRSVWVVYDLSPTATVGDRVGSQLLDNTSVGVASGTVYAGTFPLDSGLVTIQGPVLTVNPTDIAPAQARQGRLNVPMLRLDLSVDFGQVTVSGLRVDKRGTSTLDSDVSYAAVWLDNGNGAFDLGDTFLGKQAFVGGTTVIGFGAGVVVAAGTDRAVFVTYDLSAAATVGSTVSARLADATYVPVSAGATVSDRNFPITSSAVMIIAGGPGAILSIASVDLAAATPQVYRGQAGVAMEQLILSVDANEAIVSGMRLDKRGTSALDADVSAIKLYQDSNRDGNLSSGDALLGSTTFVGGVAIFGSLAIAVAVSQPVSLFVTMDVALTATLGRTIGVGLANENYLAVDLNSTVDPVSFPIRSSNVLILAEPLGTISGTVSDGSGNPLAGVTVTVPELLSTTTTDSLGRYSFENVTMGTYHVVAVLSGYQTANQTVSLTPTEPNKIVNLLLTKATGALDAGSFLLIGVAGGLVLLALLGFLLFIARRRGHCPICGKPKARDHEVCPECEAKGLRPGAAVPPPPPSS